MLTKYKLVTLLESTNPQSISTFTWLNYLKTLSTHVTLSYSPILSFCSNTGEIQVSGDAISQPEGLWFKPLESFQFGLSVWVSNECTEGCVGCFTKWTATHCDPDQDKALIKQTNDQYRTNTTTYYDLVLCLCLLERDVNIIITKSSQQASKMVNVKFTHTQPAGRSSKQTLLSVCFPRWVKANEVTGNVYVFHQQLINDDLLGQKFEQLQLPLLTGAAGGIPGRVIWE